MGAHLIDGVKYGRDEGVDGKTSRTCRGNKNDAKVTLRCTLRRIYMLAKAFNLGFMDAVSNKGDIVALMCYIGTRAMYT